MLHEILYLSLWDIYMLKYKIPNPENNFANSNFGSLIANFIAHLLHLAFKICMLKTKCNIQQLSIN